MKVNKYWSIIIFSSVIWHLLGARSPAQAFELGLPIFSFAQEKWAQIHSRILAQKPENAQINTEENKDLNVQHIKIARNVSDRSLLNVEGEINNRSKQDYYVYYIVAKFISGDLSIKQAIIPVNREIKKGEPAVFTHEISTASLNSIAPETVKFVVVKYEYR